MKSANPSNNTNTFVLTMLALSDLEWFLAEKNIIKDSELDEDPKLRRTNVKKAMSSGTNYRVSTRDSDDEDDDTEY